MPSIADLNKKYAGATTVSAPKPKPGLMDDIKGGVSDFWNGSVMPLVKLPGQIYNATKTLGQGLSASSATEKQIQTNLNQDTQKGIQSQNTVIQAIHKETDPAKKQQLVNYLQQNFSTNTQPTEADINPAVNLTNKQVVGSATQLAALAAGGYSSGAPITQNALIGAGFMGGASAQANQSNADIATNAAIGGIAGGGATAVMPYANNLFTGHPIFNRPTPIMNPDLATATAQRAEAATSGVNALNQMGEQVGQFKSDLGTNFQQGAKNLETANPNTKLTLSNKTLDSLNNLREGKNFALPEGLDQESNPLLGSNMGKDFLAKNAGKLTEMQNAGKVELTHTQTQDLIRRLNKLTFDAKASGDLAVNQQTIGLTNEIKQNASKTFGPEWDKVYSNYSQGINAVEKLNDIVNLDKNATPTDLNKSLNQVLKLGETPEGKIILRQAIEEFKNTSGIDLSNPVGAMHQILDKQIALEQAQTKANKGTFVQQFTKGATNPQYLGKRLVEGAVISIVAYGWLRKLAKQTGIIP